MSSPSANREIGNYKEIVNINDRILFDVKASSTELSARELQLTRDVEIDGIMREIATDGPFSTMAKISFGNNSFVSPNKISVQFSVIANLYRNSGKTLNSCNTDKTASREIVVIGAANLGSKVTAKNVFFIDPNDSDFQTSQTIQKVYVASCDNFKKALPKGNSSNSTSNNNNSSSSIIDTTTAPAPTATSSTGTLPLPTTTTTTTTSTETNPTPSSTTTAPETNPESSTPSTTISPPVTSSTNTETTPPDPTAPVNTTTTTTTTTTTSATPADSSTGILSTIASGLSSLFGSPTASSAAPLVTTTATTTAAPIVPTVDLGATTSTGVNLPTPVSDVSSVASFSFPPSNETSQILTPPQPSTPSDPIAPLHAPHNIAMHTQPIVPHDANGQAAVPTPQTQQPVVTATLPVAQPVALPVAQPVAQPVQAPAVQAADAAPSTTRKLMVDAAIVSLFSAAAYGYATYLSLPVALTVTVAAVSAIAFRLLERCVSKVQVTNPLNASRIRIGGHLTITAISLVALHMLKLMRIRYMAVLAVASTTILVGRILLNNRNAQRAAA